MLKKPLGKKKSFALFCTMVTSSSILLFLFSMSLIALPYVFVSGTNPLLPNKETYVIYLGIGLIIGVILFKNGIRGLWRMVK